MPPPPATSGIAPAWGWGRRNPGLLMPTSPAFIPDPTSPEKAGTKLGPSCPHLISGLKAFSSALPLWAAWKQIQHIFSPLH